MKKVITTLACAISLISCTKNTYYHYPCVVWADGDTLSVSYVRHSLLSDTMLFRDHTVSDNEVRFTFIYADVTLPVITCHGVTEFDVADYNQVDSVK